MVGNLLIGVIIALMAALFGGWIGVNTKQEIKKFANRLSFSKEILVFLIGLLLILVTTETAVITLVIIALGALTTTILNKFWLGRANRYFEIALLGLATGGAFALDSKLGFLLIAFVVLYNLITESVATVTVIKKKKMLSDFKGIGITQLTYLFGVVLSYMLFEITHAAPIGFLVYIGGSILFLVFEPRLSRR